MEISGSYNRRHFLRSERIESVTEDINHHLEDFYFRNRRADARENMWEGNFLYTHTYGKGNEWSVNYTYSSESEDEQNEYSTMQMENDT
ncbi:UNVERIFIED_CONTAM: TonB-dependent receptor, partial [Bacteroidetes bacterium 56_B9]